MVEFGCEQSNRNVILKINPPVGVPASEWNRGTPREPEAILGVVPDGGGGVFRLASRICSDDSGRVPG